MSWLTGALNLADTDRSFVNTVGVDVVYDAVMDYVNRVTAETEAQIGVFVEETTELYKERYYLAGGGLLDEQSGQAPGGLVKAAGNWDVAYPLKQYGNEIGGTRVVMAYMTLPKLVQHVDTVLAKDANTVGYLIRQAMLRNDARNFNDPDWGTLAVQPLANGDGIVYPSVMGSDLEATSNHYLVSGYASASISDANNPFGPIVDALEQHFGTPTGGSRIVAFVNKAEGARIQALVDFDPVTNRYVIPGTSHDTVGDDALDELPKGGWRVLGVMKTSGAIVVRWDRMPAGYILAVHLDAPKPLKQRVDPEATGLGRGLQLVANRSDHPFLGSVWEHRMGFGVGNRLNGVVMQLTTNGAYAIPTGY